MKRIRHHLLVVSLASIGFAVSCASSPSDAHVSDAEADYYARLAQAYAGLVDRCCARVGLRGAVDAALLRLDYIEYRPRPGSGAVFDAERGALCVAALESASCTLTKEPPPRHAECDAVYTHGNLAVGAVCVANEECARSDGQVALCIGTDEDGALVSRCRAETIVGEGASCSAHDDANLGMRCADGLRCDFRTVTCETRPELNQACETTAGRGDTCASGAMCDRGTATCVTPPALGTACTEREQCEGNACVFGECREPLYLVDEWQCAP